MKGSAAFRRWLCDKLKQSRWALKTGESVEDIALRLGVQPDVLIQAQRELDEERRHAGRTPIALGEHYRSTSITEGGVKRRLSTKILVLPFPEPIFRDWQQLCRLRGVTSSLMLRSVIHTVLSGPENPRWTGGHWLIAGVRYEVPRRRYFREHGKQWPYTAHAKITHGAQAALTVRATAMGVTSRALVRGAVIDLLEGRLRRVHLIAAPSSMFDDANKYWTGARKDGGT